MNNSTTSLNSTGINVFLNSSLYKWSVSEHTSQFAVIPMFIALGAMVLHGLACRVLWVRVVRDRLWYRTTVVPLPEVQLALFIASCCAMFALVDLLLESGELLLGKWVLGDVFCRFFNGFRNANYFVQTLVCLFLLERVILNRNLAAQIKIFAATSSMISAIAFAISFAYSTNLEHRCVLSTTFTIRNILYLPHYVCVVAIIVLTVVAVYVVRKRRSNFSIQQLQDMNTIDDVERSLRRIENLCLAISSLNAFAFTGRMISKVLVIYNTAISLGHYQMIYLGDGLWESTLLLLTGSAYFWFYPNFCETVKKYLVKADHLDQSMNEAILSNP